MEINESQQLALNKLVSFYQIDADLRPIHRFFKKVGKASVLVNTNDFLVPKEIALPELLKIFNLPMKIYGSRTNTLITEEGFNGIFVIDEQPLDNSLVFDFEKNEIVCEAAGLLSVLVRKASEVGFNLGALAGIPGTVGAAVFGNAGAGNTNKMMSDFVKEFEVINLKTSIKEIIVPDKIFFAERRSGLQDLNSTTTNYYILKIKLRVENIGPEEALIYFKERIEYRAKVNAEGYVNGTAGSFWANRALPESFKKENPGVKVRDLIVKAGLDKLNINGARYTPNYLFLATDKQTTDNDVAKLLDITISTLESKFGITPHKEVEILSKDGVITVGEYIQKNI